MNADDSPVLDIQHLSVGFRGLHFVQAVEDVTLQVCAHERMCIIGETGSGKSILLLAILRLLDPGAEVTGDALYRGQSLFALSEKDMDRVRGGRISYVPQGSGNGMNPLLTVGLQVGEPLMAHRGVPRREAKRQAIRLLRVFHLEREEALARQYPFTLSGGMRQRALIAMGVSAGADVMFADEPTKGLDESRIDIVIRTLNSLTEQTLVCVTHDLRFARAIATRICVMYAAQQVETGDVEALFRQPLHPYTADMLAAMPENGLHVHAGFTPEHGSQAGAGCRYYDRCVRRTERCKAAPPEVTVDNRLVRCWLYA